MCLDKRIHSSIYCLVICQDMQSHWWMMGHVNYSHEWVTSHVRTNESCEWTIWMSLETHTSEYVIIPIMESCHTYEWMSKSWVMQMNNWMRHDTGVAVDSRIDKIIGLFCRTMSLLQGSFAKETYNFIDPTDRSHPIRVNEAHLTVYIYRVYRAAKTHRMPYLYGSFSAKKPYN